MGADGGADHLRRSSLLSVIENLSARHETGGMLLKYTGGIGLEHNVSGHHQLVMCPNSPILARIVRRIEKIELEQ